MVSVTERDPRHHVRKMQNALREIKDRLREDIVKIDEPELKAMFEKTAEVIVQPASRFLPASRNSFDHR